MKTKIFIDNTLIRKIKTRNRSINRGKTCGRGNNGQKSRNKVNKLFQGGQFPLHRSRKKNNNLMLNRFVKKVNKIVLNINNLNNIISFDYLIDKEVLTLSNRYNRYIIKILGCNENNKDKYKNLVFNQSIKKKIKNKNFYFFLKRNRYEE